ncbi:MAG: zinc ribbon domain-containing protein, partial [Akkermansia sp.]|nr:zinc ribbon domain-containing protein [Akkermansia sp.]
MPVCPQCSANIHTGALYQCPACGYSLRRAEGTFGSAQVEFTRVVDVAGALKHQDRMNLMHFLQELERNLPPVALCVYITDHGRLRDLRPHAHWILNHARIHHPSFGKRELNKAYEDRELREDIGGHHRHEQQEGLLPTLAGYWDGLKHFARDIFHPYSKPVKMEWALILVMDVQLEMACFSWGYRLDPYINPEKINKAILSARLQFRERATAAGIKRVMKEAVRIIATDSRGIMRRIRKDGRVGKPIGAEKPKSMLPPGAARLLVGGIAVSLLAAAAPAQAAPAKTPAQKPAAAKTPAKPSA